MKSLFYSILILCSVCLFSCNNNKPIPVKTEPVVETPKNIKSVVFIVVGKDIDYKKMAIDDIIGQIIKDSILSVKTVTPEVYIEPQIIKVYRVEDITCPYLKDKFKNKVDGELVYQYRDNILVKLKDGVIKIYHSHVKKNNLKQ